MAESPKQDTGSEQLELVTQLAHDSFEPLSEARSEQAFEATLARLSVQKRQARRRWQVLAIAAAAAALLVVGALTSRFLAQPRALAVNVDGAELRQDGLVQASGQQQPSLRFSDGTRIGVGASATLRVRSTDAHGARIAVEQGEIRAEVVHAPLTSWVFEAGPFTVDVKGTVFALAWSSAEARLELRLESGALVIHTPFTSQPISLQGGQRLVATARDERFVISALSAPAAEPAPANAQTAAASPGTTVAPAAAANDTTALAPSGSAAARSAWAERFAAGDFPAIVADAEQQGFDAALAQRALDELALLADAARYTGKTGLARRALLAQRQRFGKSSRAVDAAFMLGRLEEPSDPDEAIRWYDRYLADAPRGSYAAEALGRKLLLVERLRGAAAARPLAEQYAKKYPQGPHAQSAGRILGE